MFIQGVLPDGLTCVFTKQIIAVNKRELKCAKKFKILHLQGLPNQSGIQNLKWHQNLGDHFKNISDVN